MYIVYLAVLAHVSLGQPPLEYIIIALALKGRLCSVNCFQPLELLGGTGKTVGDSVLCVFCTEEKPQDNGKLC
jgi:hypothetical protein